MYDLDGFNYFLTTRRGRKATKPSTRLVYLQSIALLYKETELDVTRLKVYFTSLLTQGRKASYLNRLIVVLHLWGEFRGVDDYKVFRFLEQDAVMKSTLSEKEIRDFLALPSTPKMKMFWSCMVFSGMRPGECATLTSASVLLGQGVFSVNGKTGPRLVPIAPNITEDLQTYIKGIKTDLLFPGSTGKPITRQAWQQDFEKRIKKLGIKRPGLTAHSMRHSFLSRNISEIDLFSLKRIVGHKRIETTEQYVHLSTKDIVKAIKKDPLALEALTFYERFKRFREGVTELLESLALSPQEEEEMLKGIS